MYSLDISSIFLAECVVSVLLDKTKCSILSETVHSFKVDIYTSETQVRKITYI